VLVEERPFMAAKGIAFLPRFSAGAIRLLRMIFPRTLTA
jgi:hypothetical protein